MFGKMCEHSNGWRPEDGVPDLAMMSDITTEGINTNLRTRYQRDQIYTFSGSVLIAVNPYKQLDIYNGQWISRYRQQKLDQTDPHIFALTEAMYMNLVRQDISALPSPLIKQQCSAESISNVKTQQMHHPAANAEVKNQACVISGESGAGKTETTKFILSYLCSVTPNKSIWMEHQILEANTILEAFGNAKTIRNDNSSRFGKFIQICFDARHQINGCIIQDYLLEQSRITCQSIGERNYHVFYQLLAAGQTNQELRKKFHLMPANFYNYLNTTQCFTIDSVDDCSMFDSLRTAMSVLNVEQDSCDGLFQVLSAILWLGNLQFQCDDTCQVERSQLTEGDMEIINIVTQLLGVDSEKLAAIMLKRQINVRGSITEIPFKLHEAKDNRNGMSKALYSRLFTWVVNFINASTNPGLDNSCFLGVLDIFGFENFDTNSFEQLCINYTNEKLHKFFNHHMFAIEQELYRREGIEFCDINFTDNTPCLELLEKPPSCILRLLSEECRMPKGSDSTFVEKLHTEFSSTNPNAYYIKGVDRRNWSSEFSVRHFAGPVTYSVDGFLKKNKDSQQNQLMDIIESSTNPLLRELATCHSSREPLQSSFDVSTRSNSLRHASVDLSSSGSSFKAKLQSQQSFSSVTSANDLDSVRMRRESSFNLDSTRNQTINSSYSNASTKSKPTVADAFRHQLATLVDLLGSVNPWYVRCIKPNLAKSSTNFDDRQVSMQLRYLGMTDLIRIRREGFPIHLTKHQFVCRYRCLMLEHVRSHPNSLPIRLDEKSLENCCVRMMNHFNLDKNNWRIGKTMVLLRASVYQPMEERRNMLFMEMATKIQNCWRGFVHRRRFLLMKASARKIQESFRAFRGRLLYIRKKRAILTIQAYCRGMFAREIANALREIKRVEHEKAVKLAAERLKEKQAIEEQRLQEKQAIEEQRLLEEHAIEEQEKQSNIEIETAKAPLQGLPSTSDTRQKIANARDKKEMNELVKILERHGISLDTIEHNCDGSSANFERLYDVLGNHLQATYDTQSISPSVNDDDRFSFATTGTTCDGDSMSCSEQSQISSTVADEHACQDERRNVDETSSQEPESTKDETINHYYQDAMIHNSSVNKYQSNSIESIASLVSSTSVMSSNQQHQLQSPNPTQPDIQNSTSETSTPEIDHITKSAAENRTSTFTGNFPIVGGSRVVSNGRPLTRIEEEPNSISSPSKTPVRKNMPKPQSLFSAEEEDQEASVEQSDSQKNDQTSEIKKRRLERRIFQVQQEKLQQPINPTTAGVPTSSSLSDICENPKIQETTDNPVSSANQCSEPSDSESIYGSQKSSIIEYAEQVFNSHPKDLSNNTGMIRTLTRRRRSVETACMDHLTKGEMLSYNSSFSIPTSHIKMHDPHSSQTSCSIFKNLCKYMTGESAKSDTEVRIIQSIIRNGIEKVDLRDEIYVQIIRQLTNNPNQDYCLRLWILLGLVSAAFAPSKNFLKHLIGYLRTKPRKDPSITCYAQFCLDNLQAPRIGSRKYPPSLLEIQACKILTNLTCKVHLLDGRCETLSVHPCDTALDALTKLAHRVNLQSIEGWSLYESYIPGSSKYSNSSFDKRGDFERAVKSHSYMADLIASWQNDVSKKTNSNLPLKLSQKRLDEGNFKLTLKKRIFRGPKIRNDPVEINLLYAQAVHNVVKKDCFYVDENLGISLAGLQAQVVLGNAVDVLKQEPHNKRSKSTKPKCQLYDVENYICLRLRNQTSRTKKEWCNLIHQAHKQFHNVVDVFCKMRYLSMVIYHCPLYGTATFHVVYKGYQTIDQNLMLGVNAEGLVLVRSSDKALINAYRYGDICQDRGITVFTDENIIQFNVKDRTDGTIKCLSFESSENEEIAMLLVGYCTSISVYIRGSSQSHFLDPASDLNVAKKRTKLKMTLEDRMRTHQEVQNARRAIIKSGKLRKPNSDESSSGLLRHTFRRLSSNKAKGEKISNRFEGNYGTIGQSWARKIGADIPHTSSDYHIYGNTSLKTSIKYEDQVTEIAGATASTEIDETTKAYPHRYWAYSKTPLKNSILTIYDPDLEEAALSNFCAILTYSGLNNPSQTESGSNNCNSTLDSSSIDSGIASQQSLSNLNGKTSSSSPSSVSSGDIYDVCPKKMDERDLIRLAQGILDRCLKKDADILKNEFFLQLIKQTTDHPDPNSEINRRHWQLLALACSVTYPSDGKILSYLYSHLRRCSLDQVTGEGQYAQFTLRSLQGTLDTKGRRYAPSEMEILSTINCRRVYARVYFLDGQFQAVEFDPCATIAEVVDQIKHKIGLKPDCNGYALFQQLDEECEQVMHPEDKVGDAIAAWEAWNKQKQIHNEKQSLISSNNNNAVTKSSLASLNSSSKQKNHKFIFKKYLFVDNMMDLNDPVERELLYHQTVASIKEDKFPILEQEATILCALKAQIEIGDYTKLSSLPREHIRMVYKQVVMSLMPPHSFNSLPVPAIAQQHQAFRDLSCIDAKKYFFNLIQSFGRANLSNGPGYILLHRAHVYDATQTFATAWPSEIWIVINQTGLHMLVTKSRRVLASCEFRQIIDYNSNNNYLMLILLTSSNQSKIKYTFYTKQAQQIAQQMRDYVVISSSNGNRRKKSVEFNLKQQAPKNQISNSIQC